MGFWQLILILLIVLVLFGSGRISKIMGELGRGIGAFKQGLKEGNKPPAVKKLPKKKK